MNSSRTLLLATLAIMVGVVSAEAEVAFRDDFDDPASSLAVWEFGGTYTQSGCPSRTPNASVADGMLTLTGTCGRSCDFFATLPHLNRDYCRITMRARGTDNLNILFRFVAGADYGQSLFFPTYVQLREALTMGCGGWSNFGEWSVVTSTAEWHVYSVEIRAGAQGDEVDITIDGVPVSTTIFNGATTSGSVGLGLLWQNTVDVDWFQVEVEDAVPVDATTWSRMKGRYH